MTICKIERIERLFTAITGNSSLTIEIRRIEKARSFSQMRSDDGRTTEWRASVQNVETDSGQISSDGTTPDAAIDNLLRAIRQAAHNQVSAIASADDDIP